MLYIWQLKTNTSIIILVCATKLKLLCMFEFYVFFISCDPLQAHHSVNLERHFNAQTRYSFKNYLQICGGYCTIYDTLFVQLSPFSVLHPLFVAGTNPGRSLLGGKCTKADGKCTKADGNST